MPGNQRHKQQVKQPASSNSLKSPKLCIFYVGPTYITDVICTNSKYFYKAEMYKKLFPIHAPIQSHPSQSHKLLACSAWLLSTQRSARSDAHSQTNCRAAAGSLAAWWQWPQQPGAQLAAQVKCAPTPELCHHLSNFQGLIAATAVVQRHLQQVQRDPFTPVPSQSPRTS